MKHFEKSLRRMTSWLRHFHKITFNISTSKTEIKFYQRSSITIFIDVFNRIKRLELKFRLINTLKESSHKLAGRLVWLMRNWRGKKNNGSRQHRNRSQFIIKKKSLYLPFCQHCMYQKLLQQLCHLQRHQ